MNFSIKKSIYILISVVCINVLLIPAINVFAYSNITPAEVKTIINSPSINVLIIDVRTPEEFKNGYIPKSINIPLQILDNQILKKYQDKNTKIIVYCQSGIRAKKASEILDGLGYKNVFNLGGINDWHYDLINS